MILVILVCSTIILLSILIKLKKEKEENKEQFTLNHLAPIYPKKLINSKDSNKITEQLPWCKPWKNRKNEFRCYINKHLQRKCYWSCQS